MPRSSVPIHGCAQPAFREVERVFTDNFTRRGELGASVCVWHEGQKVVDLWGGYLDRDRSQPWQADTLAVIFSATKGLVALAYLMLVDRGKLNYQDTIASHWPEFAQAGKSKITIESLLSHRSGLVAIDRPISLQQLESAPEEVATIIAAQAPSWQPNTDQGYHAVTFGLYAGELFRRVTGETLGCFLAREVCQPLGVDLYLGLPQSHAPRVSRAHHATTADLLFKVVPRLLFHTGTEGRVYRQVLRGKEAAKAFASPAELGPRGVANFNTARVRSMELPWCNAISDARALAKIYAVLASGGELDGVRLVSLEAAQKVWPVTSWSTCDRVVRKPQGWTLGFLKEKGNLFASHPESFGHPGAGGALGWCDPIAKVSIGYVPNRMSLHIRSPRAIALAQAVTQCLGNSRPSAQIRAAPAQ